MNKFKKILYNITRPYAKKYLTGHLGKVVEDDEKITCYVKRSKVKKKDYHYTIACLGIGKNREKVAKVYKMNKPICYVIDGLKFKKHQVYIFGYNNCEVIIKNCDFGLNVHIHVNGKCTLDNTNITTFSYLTIGANDLVIKNMDSEHLRVTSYESNIYFGADNRVDIIDSNFCNQSRTINLSFLATNELNIINSNIRGSQVECQSKTINADKKSSLIGKDKVILKSDDFNAINIKAPIIVLNGEEIENKNKSIILKKVTDSLTLKRLELVNLLKKFRNECKKINSDKVLEYQEELDAHPISKVLKR